MLQTIIIEDEKAIAAHIIGALAQVSQDIEVKAILTSVQQGIDYLGTHREADLILSDVQLGDGLSFEIFNQVRVDTPIIFITAFDHFMMSAFEHNGIDYLLKPVSAQELSKALVKYEKLEAHFRPRPQHQFMNLFEHRPRKRILVRKGAENISLRLEEVVLFYTENKVVFVVDRQGRKYIFDRNLSDLEGELDHQQFFRVNRQYIVNIDFIRSYKTYEKVKLKIDLSLEAGGHVIVVSQETAPLFKKWINEN